jgi:ABC-type multidrug transport system fused ATPase/permease subunit
MTSAPQQINDRVIYYKQADANFYQTFAYVIGRFLALTPQSFLDVLTFGTLLYWMVGLAPSAARYFIFIALLFVFNLVMNNMLGIFTSILATQSAVQGMAAFILFLCVLFSGFIVTPNIIPNYYQWLYWWNPLSWAYRSLLLNEYTSPDAVYDQIVETQKFGPLRYGEVIMAAKGFIAPNGYPYGKEWIAYSFAYLVPFLIICVYLTGLGLKTVRMEEHAEEPVQENKNNGDDATQTEEVEDIDLPFMPVDLTFKDISYEVTASTGKNKLKLLNNASGKFGAGRMCALMGTSGAGKTTLMVRDTINHDT